MPERQAVCYYCCSPLHLDGEVWVDETEGDCCSGNDFGENENQQHEVVES